MEIADFNQKQIALPKMLDPGAEREFDVVTGNKTFTFFSGVGREGA